MENSVQKKRSAGELVKRYILFVIGLFFSALAIAITKKGDLGVSPLSSIPNVLSVKFTFLSIGNWLIVWNCLLLLAQVLVLRKRFRLIQLLQIPLSFVFGYFADFGMWIMSFIHIEAYPMRLLMVVIGTIFLAFGITLAVAADVVMNSGEAIVKAVADVTHKVFGNIKIALDVFYVIVAVVLSLLLFNGQIIGTREGTVIAALTTGQVVKLFTRWLGGPLDKLLTR